MVSDSNMSPLADIFMKAGEQMGYSTTDCNTDDPIGKVA